MVVGPQPTDRLWHGPYQLIMTMRSFAWDNNQHTDIHLYSLDMATLTETSVGPRTYPTTTAGPTAGTLQLRGGDLCATPIVRYDQGTVFGAEVSGIDWSKPVSPEVLKEVGDDHGNKDADNRSSSRSRTNTASSSFATRGSIMPVTLPSHSSSEKTLK